MSLPDPEPLEPEPPVSGNGPPARHDRFHPTSLSPAGMAFLYQPLARLARQSAPGVRLSGQQHGDDPGQKNAIKRPSAADRDHRGPQRREVPQMEQISADRHAERAGDG
jgi:hypothetical protein